MAVKLEVKLTQLCITIQRTNSVLDSNRREIIERHSTALKSITDSVNELRLTVKAEENLDEIAKWNGQLDEKLTEADNEIQQLRQWLEQCKQQEEEVAREEKLIFQAKLHENKDEI